MEVIKIFTTGFYKDLFERTVFTFAQALGAVLLVGGDSLVGVDWTNALAVAGMAALLAVLKGFAAGAAGTETGASFGTTVPKPTVAAVEDQENAGQYTAEEASPLPEGTPVDVVPEENQHTLWRQDNY